MNLNARKKLNQAGAFHLAILIVLAVAIVGVVFFRIAKVSNAATTTTTTTTTTTATIKDVPYASASPLQDLDIFTPAAKYTNVPTVVLVHGGGWKANDKTNFATQAGALRIDGFTVFNINYELDSATVPAFPMEVNDVKLATQYAIAHAAEHGGNPSKIILIGGSAGGQLVGSAAEQLNDAAPGTVKAVVTLSGPTDFVSLIQDIKNNTITNLSFRKSVPQALGCTLNTCTTDVETQWSPARNVTAANCPAGGWQIFNSQAELIPLDQPNAMEAALQQQNCPVTKTILPGTKHSIGYWSTVRPAVDAFLRAQ